MITSPSKVVDGLLLIVKANIAHVNQAIRRHCAEGELHLFKGVRKTLPLSSFPSLEIEAGSCSMEWTHTSAMTSEFNVDFVLTLNCGSDIDGGLEYVYDVVNTMMGVFNFPPNMSWRVPDSYADEEKTIPLYCQYSDVKSVEYLSTKDYGLRVARWSIACRVLEPIPTPVEGLGPQRVVGARTRGDGIEKEG